VIQVLLLLLHLQQLALHVQMALTDQARPLQGLRGLMGLEDLMYRRLLPRAPIHYPSFAVIVTLSASLALRLTVILWAVGFPYCSLSACPWHCLPLQRFCQVHSS